jgi:hypothetical protein
MTGILNALIAGVSGAVKDTYFNLVSLLLPGNGTNGATNNSFVDSSTANGGTGWPITRNGDTTQGTFSPFSQTGWGNYFDGTDDYLSVADTAALDFGSGNFTIETWIYMTGGSGATRMIFGKWVSNVGIELYVSTANKLEVYINAGVGATSTGTLALNRWHHVALVRSGTGSNQTKLYIDGSEDGSGTAGSSVDNAAALNIGTSNAGSNDFTGYMSNYRVVKGIAVYTGNFTVPTSPLAATQAAGTNISAITGTETSLLTCQSNRCKDSSSTPLTVTPSGNVAVTPFSPFAPTSSYSAAAVGGSGYFDGSGDYLTIANQTALQLSGDFTIDGWIYGDNSGNNTGSSIIGDYFRNNAEATSQYQIAWNETGKAITFYLKTSGGSISLSTSNGTAPPFSWNHFALVRSGSTIRLYCNGVGTSTVNDSTQLNSGFGTWIGVDANNTSEIFGGYIANLRVVKGTAIYDPSQSTLTVPTALTTAVSGTSLLLNFTNAGVVDATAKNVLETEGNAQISTAQSKWGGGSIYFASASNSNLLGNTPSNWTFLHDGSTWTVEFWLYPTNVSSFQGLIATNGAGSTNIGLSFAINAGAISISFTRGVSGSSASFTSSAVLNANQWNYVGVTFTGSTKTCAFFINGASAGSSSNTGFAYSSSTSTYPPYIGQTGDPSYPYYFNGYIDDLRITRGVARTITANPTAPFPVQ